MSKATLALGASAAVALGAVCLAAPDFFNAPMAGVPVRAKVSAPVDDPVELAAAAADGSSSNNAAAPAAAQTQVLQLLMTDGLPEQSDIVRRGLRRWMLVDAPGAARFAQEITDGAARQQAEREVAQIWGAKDPAKAVAWATALPNEAERGEALGAVCIGLGARDPGRGTQLADSLGLRDDGVVVNLAGEWAARNGAAADAWALQQPSSPLRDQLIQRVAFVQARTDPAEAAILVVEQIPAGPTQAEAVISVVNQWAQLDPAGASAWVAGFPPGSLRERALSEVRGMAASQ